MHNVLYVGKIIATLPSYELAFDFAMSRFSVHQLAALVDIKEAA